MLATHVLTGRREEGLNVPEGLTDYKTYVWAIIDLPESSHLGETPATQIVGAWIMRHIK